MISEIIAALKWRYGFLKRRFLKPLQRLCTGTGVSFQKNGVILNFLDFDEWNLEPQAILWVYAHLKQGKHILELGSGKGTRELSKGYRMHSVEQDPLVRRYDSDYVFAPIRDGWYDPEVLKKQLPASYDLLIIDGPIAGGKWNSVRSKLMSYLFLFNQEVPIIIDDVERADEKLLMEQMRRILNRKVTIFYDRIKKGQTAILE